MNNNRDRIGLWAVNKDGNASPLSKSCDLDSVRAIVSAINAEDARNEAAAGAFRVGVKNAMGDEPAEISIYGEIGDFWTGCDAGSVCQFLRNNKGKPVKVRINSGGGLAYDGIVIHNALLTHDGPVTTVVEGIAGSAASIIAVAGSPAQIYENAQFFIHRAAIMAYGNSSTMEYAKEWLDKIDDAICKTYKAKTNMAYDKIMNMMIGKEDGTVMSASEAVAMKFCNQMIKIKDAASGTTASVDSSKVKNNAACTCDYDPPNKVYRSGSGHHHDCAVHKEWEKNGGFKQSNSNPFVDVARAQRMRTRAHLFSPANSIVARKPLPAPDPVVTTIIEPAPKNDGGPAFDVGDRVQVMEDGMAVAKGEVRSASLGYTYTVKSDNGDIIEYICEEELAMITQE